MLRQCTLALTATVCLAVLPASAQTKTVSLWHPFNLETDMIYGGIKSLQQARSPSIKSKRASCRVRRSQPN